MRTSMRVCGSVLFFCSILCAQAKIITVAGGYQGNNGPALSAALTNPTAVALNSEGNLYFADAGNCEIRRVNKFGIVSIFAGTGICGFGGDGGPAISAMLSAGIGAIVFDSGGHYCRK